VAANAPLSIDAPQASRADPLLTKVFSDPPDISRRQHFARRQAHLGPDLGQWPEPDHLGLGHHLVTMGPAMVETQLVEIEKYLNTECGAGGIGAPAPR
jgi:hypothetical protein